MATQPRHAPANDGGVARCRREPGAGVPAQRSPRGQGDQVAAPPGSGRSRRRGHRRSRSAPAGRPPRTDKAPRLGPDRQTAGAPRNSQPPGRSIRASSVRANGSRSGVSPGSRTWSIAASGTGSRSPVMTAVASPLVSAGSAREVSTDRTSAPARRADRDTDGQAPTTRTRSPASRGAEKQIDRVRQGSGVAGAGGSRAGVIAAYSGKAGCRDGARRLLVADRWKTRASPVA